jgi:hypothetical protein
MIFIIILHITYVFYKIPRHYLKCQFFFGKVQNILLYVILGKARIMYIFE